MSYTNVDQVRNHLISNSPLQESVIDQEITLLDKPVRFHAAPIQAESLAVKSLRTNAPSRAAVTLTQGTVQFSSSPIVRGSVVMASDSSLGRIYRENFDYVIDYGAGVLSSKSGGTLEAGQQLVIWYLPYTVLTAGEDYQFESEAAEIRRLSGGSIAIGETVLLDYIPVYADFVEDVLANAVAEANGLVEREIDPEGQYGADMTLGLAATYRALEIICRTAAARELSSLRGDDHVALAWIKLADGYDQRSERLLRSFRPPISGPSNPVRT